MGTDIHSMVEVQRYNHSADVWGPWKANSAQVFPESYYSEDRPIDNYNHPFRSKPLGGRNYTLFALLGDVRNGYGFAGVPTGDRLTPIGDNRGVPNDASKQWRKYVRRWGGDLHSTTHYLLPELIDHPLYRQRLVRTGVIDGTQYQKIMAEGGTPESWSGSTGGGGSITITPDEYDAGRRAERNLELEAQAAANPDNEYLQHFSSVEGRTFIQYVWEDKLTDSLGELLESIEVMKKLAPYDYPAMKEWTMEQRREAHANGTTPRDLSRVRLVIGFDN